MYFHLAKILSYAEQNGYLVIIQLVQVHARLILSIMDGWYICSQLVVASCDMQFLMDVCTKITISFISSVSKIRREL